MPWLDLRGEIEAELAELSSPDPDIAIRTWNIRKAKLAAYRHEYDARPRPKARRNSYWKLWYSRNKDKRAEYQSR